MTTIKNVKIWDNGGKTFDRYTAIIDGEFLGLSNNPFSPQGFCQHAGDVPKGITSFKHLGKRVKFEDLNDNVKQAIKQNLNN